MLRLPLGLCLRVLRLVRCPDVQVLRERSIAHLDFSYLVLQLEDYPSLVVVFKIFPEACKQTRDLLPRGRLSFSVSANRISPEYGLIRSTMSKLDMWLLDTHTLRLHHFESPEAVEEGYAILSHVWSAQEHSFQDLQEILAW